MSNPNSPSPISEYERIGDALADLVPEPHDFEGSVYPPDDVERDLRLLNDYKNTPEYTKNSDYSDAMVLEQTFTDMAERGDWFSEEEAYGDDPDYSALFTFPTSEIDDVFNHIDVIGMIGNEMTDHKILPFAIDLTYDTDNDDMSRKFRWRHVYGKTEITPADISEFGQSYIEKDYSGRDVIRTRALPLKNRHGLKIPGFASAKYYEDKNNPWDPIYEKGRIDIMPRFIVGYSTDIANILAGGMPTDEYRQKYGNDNFIRRRTKYEKAEKCAKWCTLLECHEQASDIRFMLEHLDSGETKRMTPDELEKARGQIAAMDNYFMKAITLATKKAQTDPDEMAARNYADRDIVHQAITRHSNNTYILKNWEHSRHLSAPLDVDSELSD